MARIVIEGLAILYDDRYAELLERHTWHINANGYATTSIYSACIPMHRLVMGTPVDTHLEVDHINQNKRDNRRCNLRWVHRTTNNQNNPGSGLSKYRGVSRNRSSKKNPWYAMIRREYLGCFDNEEAAARAYDKRAVEIYGDECFLNFPCEMGMRQR